MKRCLLRVVRGGSWYNDPLGARVAYRGRCAPDFRGSCLGFRLVRSKR
jgi:formylglycine-generating enzyme required for sulfatase activity